MLASLQLQNVDRMAYEMCISELIYFVISSNENVLFTIKKIIELIK